MSNLPAVIESGGEVITERAIGGGLEGAERTSRETAFWMPSIISPDQQINPAKEMADARSRETLQNDGFAQGAERIHRNSIVGGQYMLNARPHWRMLQRINKAFDETWAEEFQEVVEARVNLLGNSPECWLDASGRMTFTDMIRLGVGGFVMTGEVLATAEWKRATGRPFSTAIQMISPSRLSNPDGRPDDRFLSRGVNKDQFGEPLSYFIRVTHPTEYFDPRLYEWREVQARKPWGRRQVIHIIEQLQPGQTRGISEMVAALKEMRMTRKFKEITLQNAVINASFAAAVESELPPEMIYRSLGAGGPGMAGMLGEYMSALQAYIGGSKNIALDGAKIPHLFPGTKLNLKPIGTPGGVGTDFEQSLHRHTAAALGLSYEQFARDYTNTNYSSARASMAETEKYMHSRKKTVADRQANMIYVLLLEEDINAGNVPLPHGVDASIFYDPVAREALTQASWIGAARGQIDETKETDAAMARIRSGLSTYENECARLGEDFRRVFEQRAREQRLAEKYGLQLDLSSSGTGGSSQAQQDDGTGGNGKPAPAKKPTNKKPAPTKAAVLDDEDDEL